MGAHHGRLLHQPPGAVACDDELASLGGVARDGLFAQHVLASIEGANRPRHVQVVGQGIVDRIDLGIRQQLFIRSVGTRDREARRRAPGLLDGSRSDGHDLAGLAGLNRGNDLVHRNLCDT